MVVNAAVSKVGIGVGSLVVAVASKALRSIFCVVVSIIGSAWVVVKAAASKLAVVSTTGSVAVAAKALRSTVLVSIAGWVLWYSL